MTTAAATISRTYADLHKLKVAGRREAHTNPNPWLKVVSLLVQWSPGALGMETSWGYLSIARKGELKKKKKVNVFMKLIQLNLLHLV